jgi:hypothetical protein
VQVGCGKAEDMEAGIHEGILPSQIGHQAILVLDMAVQNAYADQAGVERQVNDSTRSLLLPRSVTVRTMLVSGKPRR